MQQTATLHKLSLRVWWQSCYWVFFGSLQLFLHLLVSKHPPSDPSDRNEFKRNYFIQFVLNCQNCIAKNDVANQRASKCSLKCCHSLSQGVCCVHFAELLGQEMSRAVKQSRI